MTYSKTLNVLLTTHDTVNIPYPDEVEKHDVEESGSLITISFILDTDNSIEIGAFDKEAVIGYYVEYE